METPKSTQIKHTSPLSKERLMNDTQTHLYPNNITEAQGSFISVIRWREHYVRTSTQWIIGICSSGCAKLWLGNFNGFEYVVVQ